MHPRLLLYTWLTSYSLFLHALPKNPELLSGEASIQTLQPGHLEIQAGHQAIVHWSDFSIAQHEKVQFVQPSSTSAILNRVQGNNPSHLLGQLLANGKVYLINPHGVIIGKDAIIRAADFLASTLDFSDDQFLIGKELLFQGPSQEAIVNYGTIETQSGNIALIGRVVQNEGSLLAAHGKASLIAGQEILLTFEDTPIFSIRPSLTSEGTASHTGKIEALIAELQAEGQPYTHGVNIEGSILALHTVEQNGKIYLKANGIALSPTASLNAPQGAITLEAAEGGVYVEGNIAAPGGSLWIKNTSQETPLHNLGTLDVSGPHGGKIAIETTKFINAGNVLAEGFSSHGGEIAIHTHGAYIETAQGKLSTDGQQKGGEISLQSDTTLFSSGIHSSQGEQGGAIALFSPQLTLVSAELNGSGTYQGGEIYVGGPSNAKSVHLSGDTRLLANATQEGNGGKIIVWADEKTVCHGSIWANAGQKGDGGFVEVSSGGEFFCGADLSAHAKSGIPGRILLDPKNLIISSVTGVYPQYQLIDPNAGGGTGFGTAVVPLSSGNIVVTKPNDNSAAAAAGAVYLYNGLTAALLSTVTGSSANDHVGSGGVTALSTGNYVVRSPSWRNGAAANAGAVTFGSGTTGISGVVSSSNSLVGTTGSDGVGTSVTVLKNGNYVVGSNNWNNVGASSAGAATFGSGTTGISGAVSSSNSLVGTTTLDFVGSNGIIALTNGNYVVASSGWDNGATANVGAVTFGSGTTGISGAVSSSNSLVGTTTDDGVGSSVLALTNGNYVVGSQNWDNGATANVGAATFANGATGITGTISSSNSLVGTTTNDGVGTAMVALTNGNYVVISDAWDNGAILNAGAVTFGSGTTGITGAVSSSNSLVGTISTNEQVGSGGVTALTNGNYVVRSPLWENGAATTAGAVTFGSGTTGIAGAVSSSNSLVGTTANDLVGSTGVTALPNGNYVVRSTAWHHGGAANAGAVTFGSGTTGITGAVSSSNSLVGTTASDQVGSGGLTALTNGNYVVSSPLWDGATANAGAATFGSGTTGVSGTISSSNSLVGTTAGDEVGSGGATALTNGNYIVNSPLWNNGATTASAGAATFANGTTGITGTISSSNSLVGTTASDQVGSGGITALTNGNYVVSSPLWHNGGAASAGAATFGSGTAGISGAVSSVNSVAGSTASAGLTSVVADTINGTFLVNFTTEGSGKVRVGLEDLDQITFARAEAETMNIAPITLVTALNTGTDLILQTNNDLTINSAITSSPGAGDLTIRAGRSAVVNANITTGNAALTLIANDLLSNGVIDAQRDPGDAGLIIADGVTINTGTGSLTLSLLDGAGKTNAGSGDVTIGNSVILSCAGSGAMTITAQEKNIVIGNSTSLQTQDGTLMLTAGIDISALPNSTLQTTGTGELILVCDALFPIPPAFGSGAVDFPQTTLQTNGGKLLIYTSQRSLNTLPATINGIAYVPGPVFVDSTTEKWGVYFPASSGIPFTIFYKENVSKNALENALYANINALVEPFEKWRWYYDPFFMNLFCWTLSDFPSYCLTLKVREKIICLPKPKENSRKRISLF